MIKLISNQISPNLNISDFFTGISGIFSKKDLDFEQEFCSKDYVLYNAARTGLTQLIKVLDLPKGKKIGIPAFTCAVTATPFLQAGYEIEWIDTDINGLIDFDDFVKKSDNISFVLPIHTFGQEVDLEKFAKICDEKNIFLLEDCAHALPSEKFISDARLYSFGREKVISCVSGGAVVLNNKSKFFSKTKEILNKNLPNQPLLQTIRLISHPLIYSLSLPWWQAGGKAIAAFFLKIKLLPLAVTSEEKTGKEDFPQTAFSPALGKILKKQWNNYKATLSHRKKIAKQWSKMFEKYFPNAKTIIPPNAFRVIVKNLKQEEKILINSHKNFYFTEWNGSPIAPKGTNLENFGYKLNSCPNAEKFTENYVTLPTNIRVNSEDLKNFDKFIRL